MIRVGPLCLESFRRSTFESTRPLIHLAKPCPSTCLSGGETDPLAACSYLSFRRHRHRSSTRIEPQTPTKFLLLYLFGRPSSSNRYHFLANSTHSGQTASSFVSVCFAPSIRGRGSAARQGSRARTARLFGEILQLAVSLQRRDRPGGRLWRFQQSQWLAVPASRDFRAIWGEIRWATGASPQHHLTNATERDAESPAQLEPKIARFSHRCAQQKQ